MIKSNYQRQTIISKKKKSFYMHIFLKNVNLMWFSMFVYFLWNLLNCSFGLLTAEEWKEKKQGKLHYKPYILGRVSKVLN